MQYAMMCNNQQKETIGKDQLKILKTNIRRNDHNK